MFSGSSEFPKKSAKHASRLLRGRIAEQGCSRILPTQSALVLEVGADG